LVPRQKNTRNARKYWLKCVCYNEHNHQQKAISSEQNLPQDVAESQAENQPPAGTKELERPTATDAQGQ
jgi:hypothetical protein